MRELQGVPSEGVEKVDFKEPKGRGAFLEDKSELRLFDTKLIRSSIESVYGEEPMSEK